MQKYSFMDDYSEGGHPTVMSALIRHNQGQERAYGQDSHTAQAKEMIRAEIAKPEASIYFVSGGTLANLIMISALLRPHEAVIAAESGHINAREAGAIEATGHKIISVSGECGKVTADRVQAVLQAHQHAPHMVKPRLVYISNSTEMGTIYQKQELQDLSAFCRAHNLYLMMDGARLPAALTAFSNDLTLSDIAECCDLFWIGGTKSGALMGEAIVMPSPDLMPDFDFHIKQRGAMLAKGRILGIQFQALFQDQLILDIAKHANQMAQQLSDGITQADYELLYPTETNQLFPIMPQDVVDHLAQKFDFHIWQQVTSDQLALRMVTSWATPETQIAALLDYLPPKQISS